MAECDSVGVKQLSLHTFHLEVGGSSTGLYYCVVSFLDKKHFLHFLSPVACILMGTTTPDRTPWDT